MFWVDLIYGVGIEVSRVDGPMWHGGCSLESVLLRTEANEKTPVKTGVFSAL
jgi:hypothetical protein